MCGIFGIYNLKNKPINKDRVRQSALLMNHRGPDAFGQWGINNLVELAHVRLSIIDVTSNSNQPFESICGNYVIVFNGEIYNYLELKDELVNENVKFTTTSDTEVLLNAFIAWGDSCVQKFNGDWAFAIYDKKRNRLFCSRDRFGIKPFNYTFQHESFIFSSEIKSIVNYLPELKIPNYNVINNYCRNSLGAQHHETWFEGVLRLKPAHNLIIENDEIRTERYWNYPTNVKDNLSFDSATTQYHDLFKSSLELRMRSDVPIGTTLSSGIDSGSIVSVLNELDIHNYKTYTATFNNADFDISEKKVYSNTVTIDEATLVKRLAQELEFEPNFIDCSKIEFLEELTYIIYHLESGHSSPAILPLTKVMETASRDVKVVLEGQGADELLSGYIANTFPSLILVLFKRFRISQIIDEFKAFQKFYSVRFSIFQFIRLMNTSFLEKLYHRVIGIDKIFKGPLKRYKRISDYSNERISFSQSFNKVLYRSHIGGLVNLLHYGDAISMSKSIESRLPFLDYRLVEFVFKLPFDYKMSKGVGKIIHREALKGIVPDFILNNPLKFGFNTPLSNFFKDYDCPPVKTLLSEKTIKRGLFDENALRMILEKHFSKTHDYSTLLYRLLSVEIWFRLYIDKK